MAPLLPWLLAIAAAALAARLWSLLRRARTEASRLEAEGAAAARGQRHPVSGLPTREPLLAAIAAADTGTLAVFALGEFDRLATFDPSLATRLLVALVARFDDALAGRRLVAHVDRGRFAVWFDGEVSPAAAHAEIARLAAALGDSIPDGSRAVVPQIETAHARWPDDDDDPAGLLVRVTSALATGAAGEGSIAGVAAAARDRYLLEQDVRRAIEAGGFHLAFQPLVAVGEAPGSAWVVGAEALVRWRHPQRGLVPPDAFVPLIEQIGLADRLGGWALDAALAAARGWPEPWRVAVNLSAQQLGGDGLVPLVERALARHGLAPARLELELTETVAAADPARAAALFDRLRAAGVGIAIDDFGTGFSSFSAVRRLRFDKIKIDREFVADVHRRRDSQAICQSIVALARGLGIAVLAEGVEQPEEYRWLQAEGCRLFQGYWFAPPLEPAAFVRFAADREGLAGQLARSR